MMIYIKHFKTLLIISSLLLSLVWIDAPAEEAVLGKGIVPGSKIYQYVVSQRQLDTMYIRGRQQDGALRLAADCSSDIKVKPKEIILLESIDMPDRALNPVRGSWQVRYYLDRCGSAKLYNVVLRADSDGFEPVVSASFPGDSIASLELVRDIVYQVAAQANGRAGSNACREVEQILVADMVVLAGPYPLREDGRNYGGTWEERWTFDVCGSSIDALIRFVPDRLKGGTDWTASFADQP